MSSRGTFKPKFIVKNPPSSELHFDNSLGKGQHAVIYD